MAEPVATPMQAAPAVLGAVGVILTVAERNNVLVMLSYQVVTSQRSIERKGTKLLIMEGTNDAPAENYSPWFHRSNRGYSIFGTNLQSGVPLGKRRERPVVVLP